eukprot:366522-Chlamydomonas_euryale.AAC.11
MDNVHGFQVKNAALQYDCKSKSRAYDNLAPSQPTARPVYAPTSRLPKLLECRCTMQCHMPPHILPIGPLKPEDEVWLEQEYILPEKPLVWADSSIACDPGQAVMADL